MKHSQESSAESGEKFQKSLSVGQIQPAEGQSDPIKE